MALFWTVFFTISDFPELFRFFQLSIFTFLKELFCFFSLKKLIFKVRNQKKAEYTYIRFFVATKNAPFQTALHSVATSC
jgi:hypothetical protein